MTEVPRPRQPEEIDNQEVANLATKRNVYFAAKALLDLAFDDGASFVACEWGKEAPNRRHSTKSLHLRGRVDEGTKALTITSETIGPQWVQVAWEDSTKRRTRLGSGYVRIAEDCGLTHMALSGDNMYGKHLPPLTVEGADAVIELIGQFHSAAQLAKP